MQLCPPLWAQHWALLPAMLEFAAVFVVAVAAVIVKAFH